MCTHGYRVSHACSAASAPSASPIHIFSVFDFLWYVDWSGVVSGSSVGFSLQTTYVPDVAGSKWLKPSVAPGGCLNAAVSLIRHLLVV